MIRPITLAVLTALLAGCASKTKTPAPTPVAVGAPVPIVPVERRVASLPPSLPFIDARTAPDQASAPSCASRPDPAFRQPIKGAGIDRPLLDRAILHHTNRARCDAGLRPLVADTSLRRTATGHSADMVRVGFFGHTSPVPGRTNMPDRLRQGGVRFRSAAENLATAKRLEIGDGQPVYPLGTDRCAYSVTPRGKRIAVRSYDSLARNLVTRWIESPGHRKNLMNPTYTRHGASAVLDPSGRICDTISATQLFAS